MVPVVDAGLAQWTAPGGQHRGAGWMPGHRGVLGKCAGGGSWPWVLGAWSRRWLDLVPRPALRPSVGGDFHTETLWLVLQGL